MNQIFFVKKEKKYRQTIRFADIFDEFMMANHPQLAPIVDVALRQHYILSFETSFTSVRR